MEHRKRSKWRHWLTITVAFSIFSICKIQILIADDIVADRTLSLSSFLTTTRDAVGENGCPQFRRNKNRHLELVHVPKTGGSSLEYFAAKHNVKWGACHFCRCAIPCSKGTTRLPKLHNATRTEQWHVPLSFFSEIPEWYQNADLFMVVRHPYSRIVSEWNYKSGRRKRSDAKLMNKRLSQILRRIDKNTTTRAYFSHSGHYIPQADYYVQGMHVLHQEDLPHDLSCLLRAYNMDWGPLPYRRNKSGGALSVKDLTNDTKHLIHKVYHQDFLQFGYTKDLHEL